MAKTSLTFHPDRVEFRATCPFAFADFVDDLEDRGVAFDLDYRRPLSLDIDPKAGTARILGLFQERFEPRPEAPFARDDDRTRLRPFLARIDGPADDPDHARTPHAPARAASAACYGKA